MLICFLLRVDRCIKTSDQCIQILQSDLNYRYNESLSIPSDDAKGQAKFFSETKKSVQKLVMTLINYHYALLINN